MTELRVGVVDVLVIRPRAAGGDGGVAGWRVLLLQRAPGVRSPGSWEMVHGSIEPGERPDAAALREVEEETGLAPERLYSIRVQPFYLAKMDTVQLAVVFCAFLPDAGDVTLGPEHRAHRWVTVDEALETFSWPSERQALREAMQLLGGGDAGAMEDVLRVY